MWPERRECLTRRHYASILPRKFRGVPRGQLQMHRLFLVATRRASGGWILWSKAVKVQYSSSIDRGGEPREAGHSRGGGPQWRPDGIGFQLMCAIQQRGGTRVGRNTALI